MLQINHRNVTLPLKTNIWKKYCLTKRQKNQHIHNILNIFDKKNMMGKVYYRVLCCHRGYEIKEWLSLQELSEQMQMVCEFDLKYNGWYVGALVGKGRIKGLQIRQKVIMYSWVSEGGIEMMVTSKNLFDCNYELQLINFLEEKALK